MIEFRISFPTGKLLHMLSQSSEKSNFSRGGFGNTNILITAQYQILFNTFDI